MEQEESYEHQLRAEIVRIGQLMHARGLLCGFEGNLSARLDDERLLMTPSGPVSYTHLRAHETVLDLVCRLLLDKKKQQKKK